MAALEVVCGTGMQCIACHCGNVSRDNVHGEVPASS